MPTTTALALWRVIRVIPLMGLALLLILRSISPPRPVVAQPDDDWPTLTLTPVVDGLDNPVHIAHAGDGSERLFVVEKAGTIRIIKAGVLLDDSFLDITGRVLTGSERGLLSVAFPPDFVTRQYFYVNYTREPDGDTVIARFHVDADDPDQADTGSEEIVLTVAQPEANHNGGQIAFGPDGYLYIGMGDGGGAGDPDNYAQTTATLLGKLLRIDVESAGTVDYAIPPDNPFVDDDAYAPEIWALGLRNPWRFSFDRATGDLYIADVGQGAREEVNFQPASSAGGENYGWRCKEGTLDFDTSEDCQNLASVPPIHEYGRSEGRSITGGFVYRGANYPAMQGIYIYGDFGSGHIWGLQRTGAEWENQLLLDTEAEFNLSSFGEDAAGELYMAGYNDGTIYRIADSTALERVVIAGPTMGVTGASHTFEATVVPSTADGPITYTWRATDHGVAESRSNTITLTWETPGTKVVSVEAGNPSGSVSDSLEIVISEASGIDNTVTYFPLIAQ